MGPIVIPPLTFGTFSTNPLHPQINHVGMSTSRHWPESRGLFKSVCSLCWVHFPQIYVVYLLEAITQGGKHRTHCCEDQTQHTSSTHWIYMFL